MEAPEGCRPHGASRGEPRTLCILIPWGWTPAESLGGAGGGAGICLMGSLPGHQHFLALPGPGISTPPRQPGHFLPAAGLGLLPCGCLRPLPLLAPH